jgi:hypothetical protein
MSYEEFFPLAGYAGFYEINKLAEIKRIGKAGGATIGRILKNQNSGRYLSIRLFVGNVGRTEMVHTLMAKTFLGGVPSGMNVCHNNGNGRDCRLSNLRVSTPKDNEADKVKHGTKAEGAKHGRAIYKESEVLAVRHLSELGFSNADIVRATGVKRTSVSEIKLGKQWVCL